MKKTLSSLALALCMALSLFPASVQAAKLPTVEDIPSPGTAYAAEQTVVIDGQAVTFQMYALKDASGYGTNYIRLRDLAYALNGTAAQFEVEYDGSIRVVPGQPYTPAGGEMTTPFTGDRIYTGGPLALRVDGDQVPMTAITLLDANGGGYTYFKLRDLGAVLDFYVGWDDTAKKVTLDTGSGSEGSSAQAMSDQELMELAEDLMHRADGAGVWIANAGCVETDDRDIIMVDTEFGQMTYRRVIGLQTIAQAEQAANDYWYSIYSRQAPRVSDHELDMMRAQLLERDGRLYKGDGFGVGDGGGYPVLDRMVSRSATEAKFAAHCDWGDEEMNWNFEFYLVLEDGAWRYLERETAGSDVPAQSMSDQELTELAEDLMDRAYNAGVWIANAGFIEVDENDFFTTDTVIGEMTYYRAIGLQTIAQAEQAAKEYWYSIFSRRSSESISDHELDMMRYPLLERDGALYKGDGFGVGGGGGYPVLDRLVSRSATEARFAAHCDWGDEELNYSFEFALVLEDGAWRYLELR